MDGPHDNPTWSVGCARLLGRTLRTLFEISRTLPFRLLIVHLTQCLITTFCLLWIEGIHFIGTLWVEKRDPIKINAIYGTIIRRKSIPSRQQLYHQRDERVH